MDNNYWYGKYSDNFKVSKLKYISTIITGNTPSKSNDLFYKDGIIDWVKPDNITDGHVLLKSKDRLSLEGVKNARVVPQNSTLVCAIGTIGKLAMNKQEVATNQQINTVIFEKIDKKYGFYMLISMKEELKKYSNKVVVSILNKSSMENLKIIVPILLIQRLVCLFLDSKLSEIDKLIFSKEKQIKLLEEQRQAMITEAVTKGLNPNVKMKDSGVEWIGDIPEHWNLKKLKYISRIRTSNVNKKSNDDEKSVKLCNYTDVYYNDFISNSIDFMRATATKEQIEKFTLKTDNVLITKDSENPNDIGIPAYVVEDFVDVVCGYHLTVLEPKKSKMLGKYLYYSIVAKNFQEQFHSKANGVTRYGLTLSSIGDSLILEPTIEEQLKIISKLDSTSSDYKSMKEKIKKQIIKLKEYRQSLIHEAVTGKIPIEEMEAYLKEAEKNGD